MLRLRKFMFDEVYLGAAALRRAREARTARCAASSTTTWSTPTRSPEGEAGAGDCQRVADYIAGMTDRYASPASPS